MKLRDFHARLKEYQLAGAVHKKRNSWVVHHEDLPDFQFTIQTSSHGDRVVGVMPKGIPKALEQEYRKLVGTYRRRRIQVPQKMFSPNQFFNLLGKIARGEA